MAPRKPQAPEGGRERTDSALARIEALPLTSVNDLNVLTGIFVKSGYFTDAKDAPRAAVKILWGRDLGLPPTAAMSGINIIQGKPAIGATLMGAIIQRSGQFYYETLTLTDTECSIQFYQKIDATWKSCGPPSTFTDTDAKKAGLAFKQNYRQYPRNMLFARALSNGARWYCPSVFGGPVYVPEELGATVDSDDQVVTAPVEAPAAEFYGKSVTQLLADDRRAVNKYDNAEVDFQHVVALLDESYRSWRKTPVWTKTFFGEALIGEEALHRFATETPQAFTAGVAMMKEQA